jgi:hypothetical protein
MNEMEWPTVEEVAERLSDIVCGLDADDEEGDAVEVRLQVMDGGAWSIHTGDPSYDTDHRGFWGSAYLDAEEDVREVASDLISQARDHCAETSE